MSGRVLLLLMLVIGAISQSELVTAGENVLNCEILLVRCSKNDMLCVI